MKYSIALLAFVLLSSCTKKETETVDRTTDSLQVKTKIKANIADFKTTQDVDDASLVPFNLYSKKDSVLLFTEPREDAPALKIVNDKFNHYYGFKDIDGFFEMHYQLENNPRRTVLAYVLKSEFTKDSQLSLQGVNLNEMRGSTKNSTDNFTDKNFSIYGTVSLIDQETYQKAKAKNEKPHVNPAVQFDGKAWTLQNMKILKDETLEEEQIYNEYIGNLPTTELELFLQGDSYSNLKHFMAYHPSKKEEDGIYFLGMPAYLASEHLIAAVGNNSDVGKLPIYSL